MVEPEVQSVLLTADESTKKRKENKITNLKLYQIYRNNHLPLTFSLFTGLWAGCLTATPISEEHPDVCVKTRAHLKASRFSRC
ncbi:hypothetical protein MATL_G00057430 [Megalops atlanticus]|uniref:Uncharacterized protein n=1 Tax=Megalops atlanticus TaxID=7932 RepID=A0A9D3TD03_MEGAT|nr:hypothetical protein MATL_G00057430 [Megalops atlanticus]